MVPDISMCSNKLYIKESPGLTGPVYLEYMWKRQVLYRNYYL